MQGVLKHFRKENDNEPTRSISIRFCVHAALFFLLTQQLIEIIYVHIITREEEEAREGQKENKQTRYI